MSFNSDASSPSTSSPAASTTRDWIFPSYSSVYSRHNIRRTPRRKRFSSHHPQPPQFNSGTASLAAGDDSNSVRNSVSRLRPWRFEFGSNEKSTRLLADGFDGGAGAATKSNDAVSSGKFEVKEGKTTASEKTFSGFLRGRLRVRWQPASIVSVSSLLYSVCLGVCMCVQVGNSV